MKEELKNVKEGNKSLETVERSKGKLADEFICRICDLHFVSKKKLKMHNHLEHTPHIKCESCEETFAKNCDLESHVEKCHDSVEKFECIKCGKIFVLKWRLIKHQDIHNNQRVRKCHYFNNLKNCPFEAIGCMFDHSLSEKCIYGNKCTIKLCAFQHEKHVEGEKEQEENVKRSNESSEKVSDGDVNTVDQSNDEDEEHFQTYVKSNFPALFKKFKAEKTIKCYYCNFPFRSRKLRDLEYEMVSHIKDTHKDVIEVMDTEIFDDEFHQDFLGLFIDEE